MLKQEFTAADVLAILANVAKERKETARIVRENAKAAREAVKAAKIARKEAAEIERRREREWLEREKVLEQERMEREKVWKLERMEREKKEKEMEEKRKLERLEREKKEKEMEEKREQERLEREKKMEQERLARIEANRLFDERMERFNKHLGYFGQSLGNVVELILVPCIREKMNAFGHSFTRMGPNKIYDRKNKKTLTEIDLLLDNCDEAMAIEIKTNLSLKWVNRHLDRLELLRKNEDITGLKGRVLYGAVAGITIDEEAKELALEKGMYVLQMKEDEEKLEVMAPQKEIGKW